MVIKCNIDGVNYNLHVLVNNSSKRQGLKAFPELRMNEGVLFYYENDVHHVYDFSEIPYPCKIIFIDSDFNSVYQRLTKPYQRESVACPQKFKYVIEIPVANT